MLSEYTSLGVGGPADMIVIRRVEALEPVVAGLRERGIEWGLLGGGTNVLPVEEAHGKVYLRLATGAASVAFDGIEARINTAAELGRSVMECAMKNLGGMEGLVGVPGTVGGALRMNAGAYGTEIGPLVRSVKVFHAAAGKIEEMVAEPGRFRYRKSSFAPDDILLEVRLQLQERPFREILDHVKSLNERRRKSQPLKEKSAGCIFKNPPGLSTGKMIDELGMKGTRVGGAVISERHANFIVNRFEATATDIFRLMDEIRERVLKGYGVTLEEEVIVWKN
ncbi:MAG: UDP-N-acetylenolpyruvoylglucosamine reductase [Acidobacteria bacterium RIFCSPLOWO2_12_FULL_54_10]|nr:MAG: UDP-N-acetylenolpyruvoylglucosamine reductase [Acidobacteria bacterium RIFCSPLOWO2_12_FULL_54_10]